jgi:hypothetical protein
LSPEIGSAVVNVVQDDPWTGSPGTLPYSPSPGTQLRNVLRGRLREAYVGVLSEQIPDEMARCLARLAAEAQSIAGESASAPLA